MIAASLYYQPVPNVGYHRYPIAHWNELRRFAEGTERDPKDQFQLSDDEWDAWKYAAGGTASQATKYRFRFGHLTSCLRLYVKWYCYQRLLSADASARRNENDMPYRLVRADHFLIEQSYTCLDEVASAEVFADLWRTQIMHPPDAEGCYSWAAANLQSRTRAFWLRLRAHFGVPFVVPPVIPHVLRRPGEYARDESQLIPVPVIRQLVNVLSLHRTGQARLNRYHHLRWCVLMLLLTLGRRIEEVLSIPRGSGPLGPLHMRPAKGMPEAALWMQFTPNKNGPHDEVYVSPEWEGLVRYCIQTLLQYSDEVRHLAPSDDAERLILVSSWNWTAGYMSQEAPVNEEVTDLAARFAALSRLREYPSVQRCKLPATILTYNAFCGWLNGKGTPGSRDCMLGILATWQITTNGAADGPIYRLHTHQARHTRQTVLASDPGVPLAARQYDLNQHLSDMQFPYQHAFREQQHRLQDKLHQGRLVGPASEWYAHITSLPERDGTAQASFHSGHPRLLNDRWRLLVVNNPQFFQTHRVFGGLCALPEGPGGCAEYLNCAEAHDDGCAWFACNPDDEDMLLELALRVRGLRTQAEESTARGKTVQAEKYEVMAERAERVQQRVLQQTSQHIRERLQQRLNQLEEHP